MKQVSKAIITQHNEYLLQLRDDHPGIFYANQWSFFGGDLEFGETPWQTLQRELFKELEWRPREADFFINGAIRIILSVSIFSSFRSKVIETSWFFTKGRTAMVQY